MINTHVVRPNVSMSEIMVRFRATPGATILRAKYSAGSDEIIPHWMIQAQGPEPRLSDLTLSGVPRREKSSFEDFDR